MGLNCCNLMIKLDQMSCFSWMSKESGFLRLTTPGKDAVKRTEMTIKT